jgi:hypothetical protein
MILNEFPFFFDKLRYFWYCSAIIFLIVNANFEVTKELGFMNSCRSNYMQRWCQSGENTDFLKWNLVRSVLKNTCREEKGLDWKKSQGFWKCNNI